MNDLLRIDLSTCLGCLVLYRISLGLFLEESKRLEPPSMERRVRLGKKWSFQTSFHWMEVEPKLKIEVTLLCRMLLELIIFRDGDELIDKDRE